MNLNESREIVRLNSSSSKISSNQDKVNNSNDVEYDYSDANDSEDDDSDEDEEVIGKVTGEGGLIRKIKEKTKWTEQEV